ncbi:MAG: hypothetical protein DCC56_12910 [Anaerolineae bacterium]|nr:hypothetical protein [Anaerolineales bacterium]RIK29598.1 MAG: hypothetical protein DCC56_12910 [Anaerolineae bacterium]WKZ42985.1 MAG: hypothetical protein QY302_12865 [Anaerolineales bacterium]WKZ49309.1 MAG: hypothetical protein QY306_08060 [Anaerolineales bacterium]
MKKFIQAVSIATLFLSGCSGLTPLLDLIATPTPPPPVDTPTPQPTVTLIPTRDLFATLTPTPITFTPTKTPFVPNQPTETPTIPPTFQLPSTSQGSSILTPQGNGFLTILTSHYVVYYNTGPCSPRTLTVTAFVQDIIHTDTVLIFMRPREKSDTMLLGDWSSGEMLQNENGSYYYDVSAVNIRKYYWFREAWIEYQLVAFDKDKKEIARSQVFDKNLSLVMCRSVSP